MNIHQDYLEGLLIQISGSHPQNFGLLLFGMWPDNLHFKFWVVLMLLAWDPHTSEVTLCVGLASFLLFSFLIWKMGVVLLALFHTLELS